MSKVQKKVQKSKKAILSSIQLNQNANRMREVIKNEVYPFLVNQEETIAYNKLFLQSLSGLVNGIYDERTKTVTLNDLLPRIIERLNEIFNIKDATQKKEHDRYLGFITLLKEISIHDLTYITDLPRYIDGYLLQDRSKDKIDTISIDKLLG